MSKIKACIVLDDIRRKYYHIKEIKSLISSDIVEITEILIDETTEIDEVRRNINKRDLVWEFINRLSSGDLISLARVEREIAYIMENITSKKLTVKDERMSISRRVNVLSINGVSDDNISYFEPKKIGKIIYDFPDHIVDRISKTADVVLLMGFSKILRGRILEEPEYGVLSHHSGKLSKYRGRPSCFFQYLNNEEYIYLTLQKLTPDLDGGRVVLEKKRDISDALSWTDVRLRVEKMFGSNFVEGLRKISKPGFASKKPQELGTLTKVKDANNFANIFECIRKNIRNRYFKTER